MARRTQERKQNTTLPITTHLHDINIPPRHPSKLNFCWIGIFWPALPKPLAWATILDTGMHNPRYAFIHARTGSNFSLLHLARSRLGSDTRSAAAFRGRRPGTTAG